MENQELLEIVADIAYSAGEEKFFSGNSRQDISEFIRWAGQFEQQHKETDWHREDYILAITDFAKEKISNKTER
jgi:hypothetical protein